MLEPIPFPQPDPSHPNPPATDVLSLFHQHKRRVFAIAYQITGSSHDAEDVLQTVFMRLMDRSEPGSLGPAFFQRCATNAALDVLRRNKRFQSLASEVSETLSDPRHTSPDDHLLVGTFRRALAALTPPQGELFVLKHLYGWTQQELAKRFDMTTSAVGVSIHRTKISLQQQLNDPKERSTP